jgi:hypothetical protein
MLRAVLSQFAAEYDWPQVYYHDEIDFMVSVICSRSFDGIVGNPVRRSYASACLPACLTAASLLV